MISWSESDRRKSKDCEANGSRRREEKRRHTKSHALDFFGEQLVCMSTSSVTDACRQVLSSRVPQVETWNKQPLVFWDAGAARETLLADLARR